MSRVYGGIHFQFANFDGKKCGKMIAEHVTRNYLLANDKLPLLTLESSEGSSNKLRIHGHIPAQCVLEGSTNLLDWQPLSTNSSTSGGVVVTNGIGSTIKSWFYRVREWQ